MGGKGRGGYGESVKIYILVQVCLCLPEIKYLGLEYKIYGPESVPRRLYFPALQ
jgi:hypothetical protein